MQMIFQVCIETKEATPEEVLERPNGSTLEPDSISIEVRVNEGARRN